jgi:hypothetical protein
MDLLRKLTITGVGLAFVFALAVTESNAQRRGSYYGNRGNNRAFIQVQIGSGRSYGNYYGNRRYSNYYGNRGYGNSYGRSRYGLSWRERRILAARRARMIRAQNRYYRTRARILNRRSDYGRNARYYRNY